MGEIINWSSNLENNMVEKLKTYILYDLQFYF